MDKEEKGQVADSFRVGRIAATIRRNKTDNGRVWFNVTFSRKYFGQDGEKDAWSFGFDDLQNLAKAAEIAFCKVWELREVESEPNAEEEAA